MSASPADRTPGRTPNGGPQPLIRRPKAADPLVRKTKKRPQRPPTTVITNGLGTAYANGLTVPVQGKPQIIAQHPSKPPASVPKRASPGIYDAPEVINSGFTSPAVAPYTDYPLVTTKRAMMEGLRLHVARFSSKKRVDPRNQDEFTRPVRLHRRDARAPPAGGGGTKDEDTAMAGLDTKDGSLDEVEKERQELLRAEREAQREAEMAQVAPLAHTGGQKRLGAFKKKTQQVYRNDQTEEQKAESKLRYEEALPWHLEDFDNKQTWVGAYEAALSDTYAMLVQGQDGVFRMVPIEKWFKFTSKQQFKTLTIEEAENRMGKKVKDPRWFMESIKANQDKQMEQNNKKATSKLYVGKVASKDESRVPARGIKSETADMDELDFEEDRFADDEENPVFEGEAEEAKEAEDRIKKDQLQANIFDLKDEKAYDKADLVEKKEKEAQKKLGKRVRKALMKREKNYIYDTDSENPYSDESESSDSEIDRLKEEERKKEEEEKKSAAQSEKDRSKGVNLTSSNPSAPSTKGTNTPPNRPGKQLDPTQRTTSSTSLKRPNSPHMSEASGNESTRKKHKKHHGSSALPTGTNTPNLTVSRPMSPTSVSTSVSDLTTTQNASRPGLPPRKPSAMRQTVESSKAADSSWRDDHKRPRGGARSGSEGEGAGSGGEMSDGSRKRIKLRLGVPASKVGSPTSSRAGSPDLVTGAGTAADRSRAGSPDIVSFPTAAELKTRIPPEGITVGDLLKSFKGAVVGEERKAKFTELMRGVSRYEKTTKLLKPINT